LRRGELTSDEEGPGPIGEATALGERGFGLSEEQSVPDVGNPEPGVDGTKLSPGETRYCHVFGDGSGEMIYWGIGLTQGVSGSYELSSTYFDPRAESMVRIPDGYYIPRYDEPGCQLEGDWPWPEDDDICYDHRFQDGGGMTYWGPAPTLGEHGDYERQTFYLHMGSRKRRPVPPGWVVPRRDDISDGNNDGPGPGIPSDSQHDEDRIVADSTEEAVGGGVIIRAAGVHLQQHRVPDPGTQAPPDIEPRSRSSTPTGSDWSETRQVIEKKRKAKRDRGRPHSDTEEEDNEDDADLSGDVTTPKGRGKKRSADRKRRQKKASRLEKGKGRAVDPVTEDQVGDGEDGDGGDGDDIPAWDSVPGPFSAEALSEIQELRTQVLERVDEIARKYQKPPAEIIVRSGFAVRLGRKPNRANDFRQHYSLHNKMPEKSMSVHNSLVYLSD
jgi:hypothetical protein